MERWVPPENMTATMLRFEFREDGGYRMRLSYRDAQPRSGKTTDDSDVVEVRFIELLDSHRIVQVVRFESSDASFAGAMRMTWTFDPVGSGTLVTVRAAEVPSGIRPEDHEAGMKSTLESLASFLATHSGDD